MFFSIDAALRDIQNGKMIIISDDKNRENEGDLFIPAEKATPNIINFMISNGKGLLCIAMEKPVLNRLDIPLMVQNNTDKNCTAFTVSVDHKSNSTGISVFDRVATIQALIHPDTKPSDFRRPGHMFPLCAKKGGVLERPGHTEAAVDLSKEAGLLPAGVICEIISKNGSMARYDDLIQFSREWRLKIITIADLINFRKTKSILYNDSALYPLIF